MELYLVITVLDRDKSNNLLSICHSLELPLTLTMLGRGTATEAYLEKYGLRATEKAVVITAATADKAKVLLRHAKMRLLIDIPGNGIMMSVPVKSVGGGRTLAYMTNDAPSDGSRPAFEFAHELIIVMLNQSYMEPEQSHSRCQYPQWPVSETWWNDGTALQQALNLTS